LPYLIGRVYFSDLAGMRELAIAVIIGGFVYVPVCWWEFRMSPHLHANLYGYHPATFGMQKRYEGFRPMGFLPGGLSLGMWMTVSALTAFWMWKSKLLRTFEGVSFGWLLTPLYFTAMVTKATLAMGL